MDTRAATLAALVGAAACLAAGVAAASSVDRHLVRGESMRPTYEPRDTVLTVRRGSPLGLLARPRTGRAVVAELPWHPGRLSVKRLVAGPGQAWSDGDEHVAAGPGWVLVGDQRVLSTDSRHHGRVPDASVRGVVIGRVGPR